MNEGGCDPAGRFYCGSMGYDKRPAPRALYRLDPDGICATVLNEVTISNGFDGAPTAGSPTTPTPPTARSTSSTTTRRPG